MATDDRDIDDERGEDGAESGPASGPGESTRFEDGGRPGNRPGGGRGDRPARSGPASDRRRTGWPGERIRPSAGVDRSAEGFDYTYANAGREPDVQFRQGASRTRYVEGQWPAERPPGHRRYGSRTSYSGEPRTEGPGQGSPRRYGSRSYGESGERAGRAGDSASRRAREFAPGRLEESGPTGASTSDQRESRRREPTGRREPPAGTGERATEGARAPVERGSSPERPKRTQPLREPPRPEGEHVEMEGIAGSEEAERRAGSEDREEAEGPEPPKYGGPRDPDQDRERGRAVDRERSRREYERRMDRQLDRQRQFQVDKSGDKYRRK